MFSSTPDHNFRLYLMQDFINEITRKHEDKEVTITELKKMMYEKVEAVSDDENVRGILKNFADTLMYFTLKEAR